MIKKNSLFIHVDTPIKQISWKDLLPLYVQYKNSNKTSELVWFDDGSCGKVYLAFWIDLLHSFTSICQRFKLFSKMF